MYIANSEQQILSIIVRSRSWAIVEKYGITLDLFDPDGPFINLAKMIFEYHEETGAVMAEATIAGRTNDVDYLMLGDDSYKDFQEEELLVKDLRIKHFFRTQFTPAANNCIRDAQDEPIKAMREFAKFLYKNNTIIFDDEKGSNYLEDYKQALDVNKEVLASKSNFISTGIEELDEAIGGLYLNKELFVLVGRMNEGKSWVGLKMAVESMKKGKKVFYYSGETPEEQVRFRIATLLFNYPNKKLMTYNLTDDDFNDYCQLVESNAKKYTGDITIVTPEDDLNNSKLDVLTLKSELYKKYYDADKYDLVIIDQLSEMDYENGKYRGNTKQMYKCITDDLAHISSELKTPIVVLCQANRETKDGELKDVPTLKEIADSDDIARVATTVVGMCQLENTQLKLKVTKARFIGKGTELIYDWDINLGYFTFLGNGDSKTINTKPKNRQQNERRERQNKHEEQSYEDVF